MVQRQIKPPKPPPLPSTLPLENQIDRLLNKLASRIEKSAITQRMRQLEEQAPVIESVDFPTPFGTIQTPHLTIPVPVPPTIDQRRKEIVKAALADDLAGLVEKIPLVGALAWPIVDAVEDTYMVKVQELMTPDEWRTFREFDKVSPLTVAAVLRTFAKGRGR